MRYLVNRCVAYIVSGLCFATIVEAESIGNNSLLDNLSATAGNTLQYELALPVNATNLRISIAAGSGDADLYVRAGLSPTTASYDCRPYLSGNNESCVIAAPETTTYFIHVRAFSDFSGLRLQADYDLQASSTNGAQLSNGVALGNLSGGTGTEQLFTIDVPANSQNLVVSMSGGSGDADLYVNALNPPTTSRYSCRPYLTGNNESCTITTPQAGLYYIVLRAYSNFSNVSLVASFDSSNSTGGTNGATWSGFNQYYASAIGKTGISLIDALNTAAARNHTRLSYAQVWDALRYTDEDASNTNNVILFYTGRSQSKSFTSSGNNDPDAWNREHSWPKSHGFPRSGQWAHTDIHHLRPTDASVNAARGSKDYDDGGSSLSEAPQNYTDADSFEPRDAVKGDVARMMFYMAMRYDGNDNTGTGDLRLVDYTGTNGNELGELCTLLNWHNQDPVDITEIERHSRIVAMQGNRNPFVDYPDWANQVWGPDCN